MTHDDLRSDRDPSARVVAWSMMRVGSPVSRSTCQTPSSLAMSKAPPSRTNDQSEAVTAASSTMSDVVGVSGARPAVGVGSGAEDASGLGDAVGVACSGASGEGELEASDAVTSGCPPHAARRAIAIISPQGRRAMGQRYASGLSCA